MAKAIFVFPGQGAQYSGMGRDLYERNSTAREIYTKLEALRPGTMEQCFSGGAEVLSQTVNTQPCLYATELAAAAALIDCGISPDMLAGFSLGEITALAVSGAVSYEDGFRIVCKRAFLMQEAADGLKAGMSAVLNLTDAEVIEICSEFCMVYPVNFNCDGQVVVSGAENELSAFTARVKERGGKAVRLRVSGGFHSPFMKEAAEAFGEFLGEINIGKPKIPIYSNVTARPYDDSMVLLLKTQMHSPILWKKTIENMIKDGGNTFVETGPGKTLRGLITRITKEAQVFSAEDVESLKETAKGVLKDA